MLTRFPDDMDRVMRPGGENYSATFGEKYPAVDRAWLSKNKEKVVIAPNKWFNVNKYDTKDLYLDSWVRL